MNVASKAGVKFIGDYSTVLNALMRTVNDLLMEEDIENTEELLKGILELLSKRRYADRSIKLMQDVYSLDYDTFVHSLNVAMISHELALWLGWTEDEIKLVTLCGLLHDVGKLRIEHSLLVKPGRLTTEERLSIQEHPVKGFELLQKCPNIDRHVRNTALFHHERFDGSGYPYGLKGDQIDKFARVVAIADVYDAMTAERVYREALKPSVVMEHMKREENKFDPICLCVFLERVSAILEV